MLEPTTFFPRRLSKQVEALEGRIRALEAQKSPALSTDDLVAKIAKLSLGPKEKPKEGKGLLRVHRDPNKNPLYI